MPNSILCPPQCDNQKWLQTWPSTPWVLERGETHPQLQILAVDEMEEAVIGFEILQKRKKELLLGGNRWPCPQGPWSCLILGSVAPIWDMALVF